MAGMYPDVDILEGLEKLASEDRELQMVLTIHKFSELVIDARQAAESSDADFISQVAARLRDFSSEVWELAEAKGIPFPAANFSEMSKFFSRDMDSIPFAEKVYNLIGGITIDLALQFLYKAALIQLESKATPQ